MVIESTLLLAGALSAGHGHLDSRGQIPAFARKYRIGCSHCHVAAPKLNAVGEAFRLNAYRFPDGQPQLRGEPAIPLGEEPWKDLWPNAVWPGELPATVPLALRIQSDVEIARDASERTAVTFRFPNEVYILGGGGLGEHLGAFFEAGWDREDGPTLLQAKVKVQRLLPWRDGRLLNLWVGLQNLYLFTFADRQIDRATRQGFLWQRFRPRGVPLSIAGQEVVPASRFRLGLSEPAIELNGLITPRFYYGIGVGQGAGDLTTDNNRRKDLYLKMRYKAGGLGLDGSVPPLRPSASGAGRPIQEHSLVLEGFGYLGSEPTPSGSESRHRSFGLNGRLIHGPLDVGLGYVWGRDDDPWGGTAGALDRASLFGKGEYLLYPWLIASLKGEWFSLLVPRASPPGRSRFTQTHVMPGLVALIRQNVRLVAEADVYPSYRHPARPLAPGGVWLRFDVAF